MKKFDKYFYYEEINNCSHNVWVLLEDRREEETHSYKVKCLDCGKEYVETRENFPLPAFVISTVSITNSGQEIWLKYSQIKEYVEDLKERYRNKYQREIDERILAEYLVKKYPV